MDSRNHELPVLERQHTLIAAPRYNCVRLALRRLGSPLRLDLTGVRDMHMIIDDQLWICNDTRLNGRPIISWSNFASGRRLGLHDAVACDRNFFTLHADLLADRVLESMDRLLQARLKRFKGVSGPKIAYLAPWKP